MPAVGALTLALLVQCGVKPLPPKPAEADESKSSQSVAEIDHCAPTADGGAPKPLRTDYRGVAGKARCDREVFTIMGGVTHALGVKCAHCHEEPDYPKMTHNKRVANWMAQELVPALRAKTGEKLWCPDCHHAGAEGTPKPLGEPRDRGRAIEFMNTVLTTKFQRADGELLRCKGCHGADIGDEGFKSKLILTDLFGDGTWPPPEAEPEAKPPPAPPLPTADAGAADADSGVDGGADEDAGSDFGGRQ